jgi:hypothetical protein
MPQTVFRASGNRAGNVGSLDGTPARPRVRKGFVGNHADFVRAIETL